MLSRVILENIHRLPLPVLLTLPLRSQPPPPPPPPPPFCQMLVSSDSGDSSNAFLNWGRMGWGWARPSIPLLKHSGVVKKVATICISHPWHQIPCLELGWDGVGLGKTFVANPTSAHLRAGASSTLLPIMPQRNPTCTP